MSKANEHPESATELDEIMLKEHRKYQREMWNSMPWVWTGFKLGIGWSLSLMFLYLLALMFAPAAFSAEFSIYPRMEYTNGNTMTREELLEFRLYCEKDGDALEPIIVPAEPLEPTNNPQSPWRRRVDHVFPESGFYECYATTVDTDSDESAYSQRASFTESIVTVPVPPRFFVEE